jgi:hypothetical protein
MAGEKYAEKAVDALADWFTAQLQTYITAIETAQSLTTGTVPAPDEYVRGKYDDDNRNLLMVFCEDGSTVDVNNGIYEYDCTVAWAFSSDADLSAAQLRARRCLTALIDTLRADRRLGGVVAQAIEADQSLFHTKSADATTRHAVAIGVNVMVQET